MRLTKEQTTAARKVRRAATKVHKQLLALRETIADASDLAYLHGFVNAGDNLSYAAGHLKSVIGGVECESDHKAEDR